MCSGSPWYVFAVTDDRADRAASVLRSVRSSGMTADTFIEILFELGWGDGVTYGIDDHEIRLNLTNLQLVALAAACAAVREAGTRMVPNE